MLWLDFRPDGLIFFCHHCRIHKAVWHLSTALRDGKYIMQLCKRLRGIEEVDREAVSSKLLELKEFYTKTYELVILTPQLLTMVVYLLIMLQGDVVYCRGPPAEGLRNTVA